MSEHFLTYINIEQFKCFHNFSANGFKRVNLIGGKNNIGKTAFLEACFINVNSKDSRWLLSSIFLTTLSRESFNLLAKEIKLLDFLDVFGNCKITSTLRRLIFQINHENEIDKYVVLIDSSNYTENSTFNREQFDFSPPTFNSSWISDNLRFSNKELAWLFHMIQQEEQEVELNKLLHEFDPNIEAFKMIGGQPQCKVNGEYRNLTELGSGFAHYISIICALHACQNRHLFIDELGNGIHYSQLDRLWEVILTISKRVQCQVFATTHSKEMLESFARVSKRLNEQDISYTTLVKNKQQEIKSLTLDYELLQDSLAQEHEMR